MQTELIRRYPANSPEAAARVLAAILVADGELNSDEFNFLARPELGKTLGLSTMDIRSVLCNHLSDLALAAPGERVKLNTPAVLDKVLADVTDPVLRQQVCRLALDAIGADGVVAPVESALFHYTLRSWGVRVEDLAAEVAHTA